MAMIAYVPAPTWRIRATLIALYFLAQQHQSASLKLLELIEYCCNGWRHPSLGFPQC